MSADAGQMLSHYRLVEKIGQGGMGVVWKALDTKLNRHIALKVLPPELTRDPERRLRFLREAQAAAVLDHPNIAVVHEVGETGETLFLAMQLLDGRTLREVIGERALPPREWVRLALPIADGLAHAHQHGVVHRDLKPDNVILTHDGQVKILDFGLAKILEPKTSSDPASQDLQTSLQTIDRELTEAGMVFGTVAYMSPEQARGEMVDHRTDIFSFGIVLYQMAAGRLPFKGKSNIETLHSIIAESPVALSEVAGQVPAEVERMVSKAMEKEPGRRYQHADDLATDLKNLQRELDSGRVSAITSGVSAATGRPRIKWRPVTAGIIGLAIVVAAVIFFMGRGERPLLSPSPSRPPSAPGAPAPTSAPQTSTVGVIGFESLGDPADTGDLNRMLMSLITTDLVESGGLQVVSVSRILSAQREILPDPRAPFDAAVAHQVASRAGIGRMLVGQLGRRGDQLFLTAELVDVANGTALASFTRTAESESELFNLADSIAEEVRGVLGVSGAEITAPDFNLAEALTSSPEAYRHYSKGIVQLHRQNWTEAIEDFQKAVLTDPTFTLAYYQCAFAQSWYGLDQDAVATLEKGLAHIDRLPPRWQVVYRASLDLRQGEYQAAYEALSKLIESKPEIPEAYYDLAEISMHLSRYNDMRKVRELIEQVLQIDPTYKILLFHLTDAYLAAGDLESAQAVVDRYRRQDPDDPTVQGAEMAILNAQGKYREVIDIGVKQIEKGERQNTNQTAHAYLSLGQWDQAQAIAEEDIRTTVGYPQGIAYASRALPKIHQGHLREAMEDLELASARMVQSESQAIGASYHCLRASISLSARDFRNAEKAARDAIRLDPFNARAFFYLGRIQLSAGNPTGAAETLRELQRLDADAFSPNFEFWILLLKVEITLSEGDAGRARDHMEEAMALPPEVSDPQWKYFQLGKVKAATGDPADALAAYERVRSIGPYVPIDAVTQILTLLLRAKIEEDTGALDRAREHYREFLDRWSQADLKIPEVEEARSRLARLTRGIGS